MMEEIRSRDAYALFLRSIDWNHFATFTAATRFDDRLERALLQTIRRLERVAQGPVHVFWVREVGSLGTPHIHALLKGTERVPLARIVGAWQLGRADVRAYDPAGGAAYYLTKSLLDADARWDLSTKLQALPVHQPSGEPPEAVNDDPEFPLLRELRAEAESKPVV